MINQQTDSEVTALSPLRKIIAARMVDAKQNIPHYRITMDIQMDAVLARREQHNTDNPANKLSVNDFVIKACAMALAEFPALNCQFIEQKVHQYRSVDISVVVAVEGGLSTPVVRDAASKTVQQIAADIKALSLKAAQGQLKLSEIEGGTFSISNLGMYGVDQFDAIINTPQCAILAVGAAKPQAVVVDGAITSATVMKASLSLDHRVIDGAVGAQFLARVKKNLESASDIFTGN